MSRFASRLSTRGKKNIAKAQKARWAKARALKASEGSPRFLAKEEDWPVTIAITLSAKAFAKFLG